MRGLAVCNGAKNAAQRPLIRYYVTDHMPLEVPVFGGRVGHEKGLCDGPHPVDNPLNESLTTHFQQGLVASHAAALATRNDGCRNGH